MISEQNRVDFEQVGPDLVSRQVNAGLYERQKRLAHAIAVWEKVRELDPADAEPGAKIRALSVSDTLARGNYRRG